MLVSVHELCRWQCFCWGTRINKKKKAPNHLSAFQNEQQSTVSPGPGGPGLPCPMPPRVANSETALATLYPSGRRKLRINCLRSWLLWRCAVGILPDLKAIGHLNLKLELQGVTTFERKLETFTQGWDVSLKPVIHNQPWYYRVSRHYATSCYSFLEPK